MNKYINGGILGGAATALLIGALAANLVPANASTDITEKYNNSISNMDNWPSYLRNLSTGKCMVSDKSGTVSMSECEIHDYTTGRWTIIYAGKWTLVKAGKQYRYRYGGTGLCLEGNASGGVHTSSCDSKNESQLWAPTGSDAEDYVLYSAKFGTSLVSDAKGRISISKGNGKDHHWSNSLPTNMD